MGRPGMTRTALALCAGVLVLAGCAQEQPQARPTIGSPSPTPTQATAAFDRSAELAEEWDLTGAPLPADWPDVPLPRGAEVVTAYAIGSPPRRTWTATFTSDSGTALDIAEPVVATLRKREYVPIAEYVGAAETNTGLYSFAAPAFAVYVVLGEDDGQPNVVLTVRGSTASDGADELGVRPPTATGAPAIGQSATPTPTASSTQSPAPEKAGTATPSSSASPDG
jgi:hypothetical protein